MPTIDEYPERTRAQLVSLLVTLGDEFPQLRLGQIIANAVGGACDPFYVTDRDMIYRLNKWAETTRSYPA